ncbi:MAG: sulfatase-like hydrolase/transferase [Victivallales bacterium]|jgi:arylsulfatase A-like enzyme|nr:sulfatase-like hydrolase/transferase [Victivallales bacterium]
MAKKPLNFILFNPDEMRAESLGCYGHPVAQTPHIDRLAAEGVRFDQCHVQHTVCSPSRCSFMTGWYPHVSGHRTLWHLLRPHEPNLLKYMKRAGYDVAWWGKNDLLATESFADSVSEVNVRRSEGPTFTKRACNPYSLDDPRYYSFLNDPPEGPAEAHHDYRSVQGAIDFLGTNPENPFLLYLPISFPHCPFRAPQPWHDSIDPDTLPPLRPAELANKPDYFQLIRKNRRLDELDQSFLRKINAVYLGMIGFVDYMLGKLLEALEESGHADDTVILFFSDHGDWAGDFGLVEKWPSGLDDCLTRIPMIVRLPKGAKGHVVNEPIECQDLMATVLELAGVEAEHTHFSRSLVPQLHGASGDPDRAIFAEGGYDTHEPNASEYWDGRPAFASKPEAIYYPKIMQQGENPESVERAVMIRTMTHKLVRRRQGVCELYELGTDPQELNNRYGDPALSAMQSKLEQRLLDWYLQTSDVVPHNDDPRGYAKR